MKSQNKNDGILRCEMFRAIRKRLCENNDIPYLEEECPAPSDSCIGTCLDCDHWLERLNTHIELRLQDGKDFDYSGIDEIYQSYLNSLSKP